MLVDRKNLWRHARWIAFSLLITVAAIAWYVVEGRALQRWPGGSTRPGIVVGIAAGSIIVFEVLLWPRKRLRSWRIGRAQAWLRAHIWLGLVSVPLVVLHSGGMLGGQLSTVLTLVFAVVIASGLWGLALQQYLPKLMMDRVPAETIYAEIDHVSEQSHRDAQEMVVAVCGASKEAEAASAAAGQASEPERGHLTFGAYRTVGKTRGKVLQTRAVTTMVPNSEALRAAFDSLLAPYLLGGGKQAPQLAEKTRADQFFAQLKGRLDPAAYWAVDEIEELCNQRRQYDLQARLHRWLHGWLLVHAPLSLALVVLLGFHIYYACMYW